MEQNDIDIEDTKQVIVDETIIETHEQNPSTATVEETKQDEVHLPTELEQTTPVTVVAGDRLEEDVPGDDTASQRL